MEILISDNCSTDETEELCRKYAERDSRIKYHRQENLLTSLENFRYVLDNVSADFFMWAADDDWRDDGFVSNLLNGMVDSPDTILCFGDLSITNDMHSEGKNREFVFDNQHKSTLSRMRNSAHIQCFHIYGIWKTSAIRRIPFNEISWWPDMPIMIAASCLGNFKYIEGVQFRYLENMKTNLEAAQYLSYRKNIDKFRAFRLVWLTFKACYRVSNLITACFGALFVIEKQARVLPQVLKSRIFKGLKRK